MARKRKPGRPKGSKNKKRKVGRPRKSRAGRRKGATSAQLRNLKKARAALKKKRGGKSKKTGRRKKATAKQLAALKLARAARELKNMPKTTRMVGSQRGMMSPGNWAADTVRANSMPSILMRVRRRPAPTLVSKYN